MGSKETKTLQLEVIDRPTYAVLLQTALGGAAPMAQSEDEIEIGEMYDDIKSQLEDEGAPYILTLNVCCFLRIDKGGEPRELKVTPH